MVNDSVEITTICPDVENSQFLLSSSVQDLRKVSQTPLGTVHRSLPRIKILGTGGTIASKGSDSSQTAGYHVDLTIQDMLSAIPDISGICELEY